MITVENLANLIANLEKIAALAQKYKLKDIILCRPSDHSKEKLHFILSKEGESASFDDLSNVRVELGTLLNIEPYQEDKNLVVETREIYKSDGFKELYDAECSLIKEVSSSIVSNFIAKELGFAPISPRSSGEAKKSEEPEPKQGSDAVSFQRKRPKISNQSSSALFSGQGKAENEITLPPEIENLLQAAVEAISKQSQFKDIAVAFFLKSVEQSHQKSFMEK